MSKIFSVFLTICLFGTVYSQSQYTSENPCDNAALLFNAKKYELAEVAYKSCIKTDPENPKTWYYLGNCVYNLKKYDEAILAYDKALATDPGYSNALLRKGYTQLGMDRYEDCIATLSLLLNQDPSQIKAFQYRGAAYMKSGQNEQAIRDFDSAIQSSDPLYSNFLNRGLCKLKISDKLGALSDFRAASDLKPGEFTPIAERVRIYMSLQMWEEGIADASLALAKNPADVDMYFCRGYAKLMHNDVNGADLDFNICLQLDPNHLQALKNKVVATVSMQKYDEAIMDLTNLIKKDSKNANLYLQRGNCFLAAKCFDKALGDYSQAIKIKKDFGEAYFNRANIYTNTQNKQQACKDMQYAAEIGYAPANAYVVLLCKD